MMADGEPFKSPKRESDEPRFGPGRVTPEQVEAVSASLRTHREKGEALFGEPRRLPKHLRRTPPEATYAYGRHRGVPRFYAFKADSKSLYEIMDAIDKLNFDYQYYGHDDEWSVLRIEGFASVGPTERTYEAALERQGVRE